MLPSLLNELQSLLPVEGEKDVPEELSLGDVILSIIRKVLSEIVVVLTNLLVKVFNGGCREVLNRTHIGGRVVHELAEEVLPISCPTGCVS